MNNLLPDLSEKVPTRKELSPLLPGAGSARSDRQLWARSAHPRKAGHTCLEAGRSNIRGYYGGNAFKGH